MGRVFVYGRVSTDEQTLDQQQFEVNRWLEKNHLVIDEVVSDEGVSGGVSYKYRNLGKYLLPKLNAGDMLVVSEISRLGRSMSDLNIFITTELKPRKVILAIVTMGIKLDCERLTAQDELLLANFAFAAQLERELNRTRIKAKMDAQRKELAEKGYFVTKAGKRRTFMGSPKGFDTSLARQQAIINKQNAKLQWVMESDACAFVRAMESDASYASWTRERKMEEFNKHYTLFSGNKMTHKGQYSRILLELGLR